MAHNNIKYNIKVLTSSLLFLLDYEHKWLVGLFGLTRKTSYRKSDAVNVEESRETFLELSVEETVSVNYHKSRYTYKKKTIMAKLS